MPVGGLIRSDSPQQKLVSPQPPTASEPPRQLGWCETEPHVDSFLLIKAAAHPQPENISTSVNNFYGLENTCHNILVSPLPVG